MLEIIDYGVENMIYISCKPTSLARDLVTLQSSGYEVRRICCVDMFPGTGHVEVICSMSKQKKPDAHIKIELTAEEYMKRAGEEHNRIMEEWEKNRK